MPFSPPLSERQSKPGDPCGESGLLINMILQTIDDRRFRETSSQRLRMPSRVGARCYDCEDIASSSHAPSLPSSRSTTSAMSGTGVRYQELASELPRRTSHNDRSQQTLHPSNILARMIRLKRSQSRMLRSHSRPTRPRPQHRMSHHQPYPLTTLRRRRRPN